MSSDLLADCPTCGQPPALLNVHAIADERDRLRQRCMAMAFLLYPLENGPREAVEGDI